MSDERILNIKDLDITFSTTAGTVHAIRGINIDLYKGETVAIVGESGSGKSVTMKAAMGILASNAKVEKGTIEFSYHHADGTPETVDILTKDKKWIRRHINGKRIAMVFQDPMTGTAATMGIEENLALAKRRGKTRLLRPGITKAERAEYKELLKILNLGLEDRLTSKVGLLSGGQRQALTLLMATLQKPKLLLLDEHTAALDPKTAAKVLDITDKIVNRDHLTTLMITHNMKDAIAHGNRLIMMDAGRVVVDISGEDKKKLTVPDLLALFSRASGSDEANDKMLLS